ncbi:uncharacterized protein PFLUO_LOCUS3895 [Penicillium psychrofluorescens]|uniref:uncharacterized protein n=1 Tax=Penicillium psychrofluorescens TaxID=3158075 RepID=UPI003CCD139B
MLAGKGVRAIAVMWAVTFVSFILVPLRLYTRVYIVKALGVDDHVYNLAWVFLLLYTIFLTIAGVHGFGQSIDTLEMDEAVKAVYMEMIGQTFAVLGMAIAKLSLGIFLLRIVIKEWHRISIWVSMISLFVVSVMTAIIFWVQRLPSESIYDPRVKGRTVVGVTPFSVLLGSWCAAVDFYFALLPWLFIWKLNMKFKEKMSIAIKDTVDLIIWSAVELAVTLICVGIPTVRPLYRVIVHGSSLEGSEGRYVKQEDSAHSSRFRMRNLGKDTSSFRPEQEGHTETYITRDDRSDEEILVSQHGASKNGIRVQEDVRLERH